MLMSQAAISSGVAGRPRPGPSARAGAVSPSRTRTAVARALRIDMRHLAAFGNGPARDRVIVIDRPGSPLGDQMGAGRLNVAGSVGRAALQDRWTAVPTPRHAEAGQRLREHRLLERGGRPALAPVGGKLDLGDLAVAGPGETGDLVKPRPVQSEAGRRGGDHRFGLDREDELQRLTVR